MRANLAVLAGFGVVDTSQGDLLFAPAGMDGEAAAWYQARVGSGRRLARAVPVLSVAALVVLVPSLVAWTLAGSLAMVLAAAAGAILGGILTVAAAGLALGLVDDVAHRETVAIGAVHRVAVAGTGPSIPWGRPVIAVLATLALAVVPRVHGARGGRADAARRPMPPATSSPCSATRSSRIRAARRSTSPTPSRRPPATSSARSCSSTAGPARAACSTPTTSSTSCPTRSASSTTSSRSIRAGRVAPSCASARRTSIGTTAD